MDGQEKPRFQPHRLLSAGLRDEAEQRELKRLGAQLLERSQKCLSGIILNEGWRLAMAAVLLLREKARSQS